MKTKFYGTINISSGYGLKKPHDEDRNQLWRDNRIQITTKNWHSQWYKQRVMSKVDLKKVPHCNLGNKYINK